MPPIWMGFMVQNSVTEGPLFDRFSLNMVGFQKLAKDGKNWVVFRQNSSLSRFHTLQGTAFSTNKQGSSAEGLVAPPPDPKILQKLSKMRWV